MTLQQCFINCCMEEEQAGLSKTFSGARRGVCSHSLTYSLGCAFALESLAICHGWAGTDLHSPSMTCVFHRCRSSHLFWKLQLCWKSRQFGPAAEGPVDRPLLLNRDGICRGKRAALVVPAPVDFLKAEDSECREKREIFQPLGFQKGGLSGKGLRNPLQIWHQNCTYLSKASPITDLWVLEHQFRKSWKTEEMLLGGFPAINDFFPTAVLLQEHFSLC